MGSIREDENSPRRAEGSGAVPAERLKPTSAIDAAKIANDAGLEVVMDHCVKIEHARILGGLNWAGVNTGIISARRSA